MSEKIGWIKMHRSFIDWEWYSDTYTKIVFIHLIITSNYKDKKWRGVLIKRGQRICGRDQLASELNITTQNVRTALKHLVLTNEITIQSDAKGSLITVTNYEEYQKDDKEGNQLDNQQLTIDQPTDNQQLTATKEDNNIRNKEDKNKDTNVSKKTVSSNSGRGKRLTSDWELPADWGTWAMKQGLTRDAVLREEDIFRDFWIAKTGANASKADWQATWRNWIRRKIES